MWKCEQRLLRPCSEERGVVFDMGMIYMEMWRGSWEGVQLCLFMESPHFTCVFFASRACTVVFVIVGFLNEKSAHTQTCLHTHVCLHTMIHVHTLAHTCSLIHTCTHLHTCATHVCAHTCTHMHIHTSTLAFTDTLSITHTHIARLEMMTCDTL